MYFSDNLIHIYKIEITCSFKIRQNYDNNFSELNTGAEL